MGLLRGMLVLASGIAIGAAAISYFRPTPPTSFAVTDSPAEAALNRPVDVDFRGVPLRQAIAELATKAGVPITANWEYAERDGWDLDEPITHYRRGLPLADVLQSILEPTSDVPRLFIEPNGDEIRLWLRHDPDRPLYLRQYDVKDLLGEVTYEVGGPSYTNASELYELVESWVFTDKSRVGTEFVAGRLLLYGAWEDHRSVRRLLLELRAPSSPTKTPSPVKDVYCWNPERKQWLPNEPSWADTPLDKPMAPLFLEEVTLEEALKAISEKANIQIVIDRARLEQRAFNWTRRGTFQYERTSPGDALSSLLDGHWTVELGYTGESGVILVTTLEQAQSIKYLRVYDMHDWPPFLAESRKRPETAAKDFESILEVKLPLREYASVDVFNGALLITASLEDHRRVRKFLSAIRSLDDASLKN